MRKSFNVILYVLRVGCRWSDVPRTYGAKLTIHRLHLELCELGAYEKIFSILRSAGYELHKLNVSHCSIDTKSIPAKEGKIGYDGHKKIKGIKLGSAVNDFGLPISYLSLL